MNYELLRALFDITNIHANSSSLCSHICVRYLFGAESFISVHCSFINYIDVISQVEHMHSNIELFISY